MDDEFGKKLLVTEIAVADELAAAAELVMGKTLKNPVVIIRGYDYETLSTAEANTLTIKSLLRSEHDDLFRNPDNMIQYTD
jgi:coenzyme F420-0:L-glutamate ligase/coenzyme F420-1:gamma-L-glutamate ligase